MCDFDLSQALEGSTESDDTGVESRCFDMTGVQEETLSLDEGLELVVSQDPVTMQCVSTLLLAVSRMKRSLTRDDRQLSNDELCSVMVDSLVEETIVETVNSSVQVRRLFRRSSSVQLITLCDQSKKDVIHKSGEFKLQAITLKGGNGDRKVNFKLSRYTTDPPSAVGSQAVLLSIPNINMHISCSMENDKAVLRLEEYSDKDLNEIKDDGNMDRFLFYKRTTGLSVTTFESVRCSGWYISTYEGENQPVAMCQMESTNFSVNYSSG